MPGFTRITKLAAAIAGLAITAGPLMAEITVANAGTLVSPEADDSKTAVLLFDAGDPANKLIVQVSAEGQNVASVTYQGIPLTAAGAAAGSNKGIFYLDNPFTGGAADLVVALAEGNSNGIAVAAVSISGAAPGVATTAVADGDTSVTLSVPVSGGFVVCGYAANGSGTLTLPPGHTAICNSNNIGSAHAAASYANGQTAGSRNYTYADTNITSPVCSAAVFVPAAAAPVISGTTPASGATVVPQDANLVAIFSEPVAAASGTIELWQTGGASPIESFDVATSPQLAFDGPTLTIDPSDNLAPNTFYYILIAPTAVVDSGGIAFAGISSPAARTFSTGSNPPLAPTFAPRNSAFGVALNANLVATFSETIQKGSGKTYDSPYLSMVHGTDVATVSYPGHEDLLLSFDPGDTGFIGVTSSTQRFQSTNSATHTLANFTVAPGSHRKLLLTASWESTNGDISATWNGTENFTVAVKRGGGRNSVVLYLDNPTPGTGDIVVTFGASVASRIGVASLAGAASGVAATSGAVGRTGSLATPVDNTWVFGVYTSNDAPTISGPFANTLHNGNPGSSTGNAGYQTEVSAGLFNYTWTVSSPAADNNALATFVPVIAAPVIVATTPADDTIGVPVVANLVATFSEPVVAGTSGFITLKRTSNNSTVESSDVSSSPRLAFSGQTLTMDPTSDLASGTSYYVLIDNGVENFFGTHPGEFSQGLAAISVGEGTFTFTHPQGTLASDLSATYRWSADLATFHLHGETSGGTTVNFTTQPDTPVAGTTTVTAAVAGTLPGRLFFDVKVTGP